MSYLVYCIVDGGRQEPRRKLRFLGYPRASIMVRAAGLGAVVSRKSAADASPDVARLLVYSKIVEWFNADGAVIPMRYGCIFDALKEVERFLTDHKQQYSQLLQELDGRVEMSARVTLDGLLVPARSNGRRPLKPPAEFARAEAGPGVAYLAQRWASYAIREEWENRRDEIRKSLCSTASGTFVRWTSEYGEQDGRGVLSVHFLVPRERIAAFSEALHCASAPAISSLVVTGPWPAYNFVSPPAPGLSGRDAGDV